MLPAAGTSSTLPQVTLRRVPRYRRSFDRRVSSITFSFTPRSKNTFLTLSASAVGGHPRAKIDGKPIFTHRLKNVSPPLTTKKFVIIYEVV